MTDPQAPPPDVADLVRRLRDEATYADALCLSKTCDLLREAADALAPQLEKFENENARPNGALQTEVGGRSLPLPPTTISDVSMRALVRPTVDAWLSLWAGYDANASSPNVLGELENALIAFGIMLRDHHFSKASGWQSMDTAPKDRSTVLGWLVVKLHDGAIVGQVATMCWTDHNGGGWCSFQTGKPILWQPLPAPPVENA